MKKVEAEAYVVPEVLATYPVRQLRNDAASCQIYTVSDAELKLDIETISRPLAGLSRIDTGR